MPGLYRDQGIVLRTHKLGEADRIISLVTEGRGKVRAVAKGVRRTKSRFGARLEPGAHVALQCYEGRELDVVTQVESLDHFSVLREDLDRLSGALSMLEVVDQVALEDEANPALYRMLLGALRTIVDAPGPLVVAGFYWKLLALEGMAPQVGACVVCDEDEDLVAFDPAEGGVLCREHRRGTAISPGTLDLVRQILGGRLAGALEAPPSDATTEVERLAVASVEHHLERRLRTVGLLERH